MKLRRPFFPTLSAAGVTALAACLGPNAVDLMPQPTPEGPIRVATNEDSLTTEWLGTEPSLLAVVSGQGVTIGMSARYVQNYFLMLRLEARNQSDETRVVDPMTIRVLDADRFELPRMRPDEAALRVADLAMSDPSFPPRYIATTEANATIISSPSTARIMSEQVTVVERDPVDQAAESFAEGFTEGYNRSIMRAARRVYDEGFTGAVTIAPNSGRRGRLYFHAPRGEPQPLIVRIGELGEFEIRPPS